MHARAAALIEHLKLAPHPEGGFYREAIRAPQRVAHPLHGQERSALTCIEFLLVEGTFSALHRVRQIEVWHHLEGDPLELHLLDPTSGQHQLVVLGEDLTRGHVHQAAVPADWWQASVPMGSYVLCGCTVAPGFVFDDFSMPPRAELLAQFPQHRALVERLTR